MPELPFQQVEIILDTDIYGPQASRWGEALRLFFAEASERIGEEVSVRFLDTSQLLHEKTHYLHLGTAPDRVAGWSPKFQFIPRKIKDGSYEIVPPGAVEEQYYSALRNTLFAQLEATDPDYLTSQGIGQPDDIDGAQLQSLYNREIRALPRQDPFRQTAAFQEYAAIRADCGEESVAHFVRHRDQLPKQGRTLTLFISNDQGARHRVAQAAKEAEPAHGERWQVQAMNFKKARQFMQEELVNGFKRQMPECRGIHFSPDSPSFKKHAAIVKAGRDEPEQRGR